MYFETIMHPEYIVYNIAHNLGIIYDLVEEAINRFIAAEGDQQDIDWGRLGYITGSIFQQLFEEPENYLPVDPETIDERV